MACVEPATGASAALIAANDDTGTTDEFLNVPDAERSPDQRIVLPDPAHELGQIRTIPSRAA